MAGRFSKQAAPQLTFGAYINSNNSGDAIIGGAQSSQVATQIGACSGPKTFRAIASSSPVRCARAIQYVRFWREPVHWYVSLHSSKEQLNLGTATRPRRVLEPPRQQRQ